MASIQEQIETLNKQKEIIMKNWGNLGEGGIESDKDTIRRIDKKLQDLTSISTLGPTRTGSHIGKIRQQIREKILPGDFYSELEDINLLDQDQLKQGRIVISDEFKDLKAKGFGLDQREILQDILENLPPHLEPYKNLIQQKIDLIGEGEQISFSQYLINQAREGEGITNPWLNTMGVQVAGTDLTGSGIPEIIERRRKQAELMQAGNLALKQTPGEVMAQVAASQATQQGDYQAPTMSQQQMVEEAQQTGGTVNPHEATKAVYQDTAQDRQEQREQERQSAVERTSSRVSPSGKRRAYGLQGGGLVGIDYLTRRL